MPRTYDDTMFIDTFEHNYTWLNGFLRSVKKYRNKIALIDPETNRQWTYGELNIESNKLAHALSSDGVTKNDVVMSALMNSPEFIFSYIGPRKIGAILNPINFNLSPGEIALLIEHNEPKVFIYSAHMADTVVKALEISKFKNVKAILADNINNMPIPAGHTSYEDYTRDCDTNNPVMSVRPHIYDEVLRLCTSGTTALPKCVPVNDINEVLSAHDIIMHYPLNPFDVLLNMTPWFHRGGCHVGGPCPSLYVGASMIIMRVFSPKTTLQYIENYKVTFIMGAPVSLEMVVKAKETRPTDLSCLRGAITMGAPLDKATCIKYIEQLSPNIFNGYGTTETLWNSFLRPYDLPEHAGSVGRSCIDDETRVVQVYEDKKAEPEETIPQDNTAVGEIIISSPAKSTYSYYKNEKATADKFYKGWMYTGDLGYWNEDGFITVCGRKDDMIIVSGENVYPTQIEAALCEFDRIADSIVTCVPDKLRGQAIVAYVVPKDPELTIKEIKDFCNSSNMLTGFKIPRWYCIIDKVPLNATGKKLHYVMKEKALEDLKNGILVRG